MTTLTEPRVKFTPVDATHVIVEPEADSNELAHIIRKPKGWRNRKVNPQAMVLEARINGTPLEALCGFVWVPTKNPENFPVCPKCKAIYEYRLRKGEDRSIPDA